MSAHARLPAQLMSAEDYVAKIAVQLEKTIKGFIEIGKLLAEAHEALGRKAWLAMVTDELPFTRRTAEKLMKIAEDARLTKPERIAKLPPHWTSLHELTLLDDEQLEYGFSENIIRPDAERKDITALKDWRPSEQHHIRYSATQPRTSKGAALGVAPSVGGRPSAKQQAVASGQSGFAVNLKLPAHAPLKDARRLFEEIAAICERFSATAEVAPGYDRLFQIHEEAQRCLRSAREEFRHGKIDNDLAAIKDAFYQLGTGNRLVAASDGSPNPRDIASTEHPYGELDIQELEGYCQNLQIITQYSPIKDLDDCAYASMQLLIHLDGNPKERASAFKILSELAMRPGRAARFVEVLNAQ